MNIQAKVVIFIIISICTIPLTISIYPGILNSLLFPTLLVSIICIPIFIIVGIFTLIVFGRRGELTNIKFPWQIIKPVFGIILVSCILLKFHIPIRLAFLASQSDFEKIIVNNEVKSNQKLGFYRVDKYVVDSVGGKYFRVNSYGDGISPDTVSYGFAYQPNPKKSPFGSANYQLFHLNGDWYLFQVSNDY
ncbi:hypothetical protein NIES267_18430 [Calothrix parasitica NIES-267]|uniref:Uncharacterized protein n=1 Tax=Calothrix parasitica NIES-267 TaxID=1973488 RepID=A0A1Z4LMG6_9CYAN|nr:hypothetical protein NIES267_18430 [Calothrix parasitica NIES-267]